MKKKLITTVLTMAIFTGSAFASGGSCNYSVKQIQDQLPFLHTQTKIVKQQKISNGICSAILSIKYSPKVPKRYVPVYILSDNGGVIVGTYFKDKKNITGSTIRKIIEKDNSKVFKEIKSQLKNTVMASYKPKNANGKKLYAFIDPLCPYCHMAEKHLKELADESGYEVNLVPLIVHGQPAKTKIESFICNGKKFNDYLKGDVGGKKTCESANEIISKSQEIAVKLGISGTPTFFTSDGKRIDGANIERLKQTLVK